MMAIGFTSCGNKSQASSEAAGTEVTASADDEAAATIEALTEQIEAKDANKFQEVLASIQDKVKILLANNPEVAKEYVAKVQDFLKENAEKIKAFVGDNETVNSAITALTAAPADAIVSGLKSAVEGISNAGEAAADARIRPTRLRTPLRRRLTTPLMLLQRRLKTLWAPTNEETGSFTGCHALMPRSQCRYKSYGHHQI